MRSIYVPGRSLTDTVQLKHLKLIEDLDRGALSEYFAQSYTSCNRAIMRAYAFITASISNAALFLKALMLISDISVTLLEKETGFAAKIMPANRSLQLLIYHILFYQLLFTIHNQEINSKK